MNSDIHALSGAYAVDAVDDLERVRFEAHLADCPDCRAEVASLRETAAQLSADTAVPPPPALRVRLLDEISRVRPLPPEVPEVVAADPAQAGATPPAPGSRRARTRAPRRTSRFLPFLAVAAAVALIAAVLGVWQPWQGSDDGRSVADRVLAAPDAQKVELTVAGASTTLVRSKSEDLAVLITKDMPAAPPGKAYQVWFQNDEGDMVSAGVMPQGPDQTVVLAGDARTATGVGITVEPASGSQAPTSDPIALYDLSGT